MHINKKWLLIGGAAILLAGIVVATSMILRNKQVEYVHAKYGPIVEAIYGLGKVKTDRVYEVKLGVIKTVMKNYVAEGAMVKRGTAWSVSMTDWSSPHRFQEP